MLKFVISKSANKFEVAEGYPLDFDLVAHKIGPGNWRISDFNSGAWVIKNLHSLKECKEYVIPDDVKQRIQKIRKSKKYNTVVNKIRDYVKEISSENALW